MRSRRVIILVALCTYYGSCQCSLDNLTSKEDLFDANVSISESEGPKDRGGDRCLEYLHNSLDKLRRRQVAGRSSTIDLSGYALHQTLRNVPVDMYVTDIKVRAPGVGSWAHVNRCQLLPRGEINAQVTFSDLIVSGVIRLLEGGIEQIKTPPPLCNMVLRLRRAGLDLKAVPALALRRNSQIARNPNIQVRTEANFLEPQFVSVHAHGCHVEKFTREHLIGFEGNPPGTLKREAESYELKIITLNNTDEILPSLSNLQTEERILSHPYEDILKFKDKINAQTNFKFQTHGPFSDKPLDGTRTMGLKKPIFTPNTAPISTITELNNKMHPIRTVPNKPFPSLSVSNTPSPFTEQNDLHDVHTEMEDVFLRGTKALLTKYLEKQLEVPLKETLMTSIGYTVSYG